MLPTSFSSFGGGVLEAYLSVIQFIEQIAF
jgi:hypothetical protein